MSTVAVLPLPIVAGQQVPEPARHTLRAGGDMLDREGRRRRLPAWFYRVDSWEQALDVPLAPNFMLWELITVDVREAPPQRGFPRYVPIAIAHLAAHLQVFRNAVGTYVHIAANGGYRSPAHALSTHASTHCWGTAANIYRVGDDFLDSVERIRRYADVVNEVLPHAFVRPCGEGIGHADDHLHLDIGYVDVDPRLTKLENESANAPP